MINIKVASANTRGFLKNLFDVSSDKIEFDYNKNNLYDVHSIKRKILAKMIQWHIFDILGIFQNIKIDEVAEDACFSYNRFLRCNKPYVIFLENPFAIVNYGWDRPKYLIARKRLEKCFENPFLCGIICMSKACYENMRNIYNIPDTLKIYQIYPYIPDDLEYTFDMASLCAKKKNVIECLYISSVFELKGGRDILNVFEKIEQENIQVHVTIITKRESIRGEDLKRIERLKSVSVVEFNLSKKELNEYYKYSAILLNPTRADSFSLVTLEAIKYGCAILAVDLYAIKEMVVDGYNGYITQSMIKEWNEDGTQNKYYRTHQKELLYSGKTDEKLVDWMFAKLKSLSEDRELLSGMCVNSLKLARSEEFSAESILNKWEKIYEQAVMGGGRIS